MDIDTVSLSGSDGPNDYHIVPPTEKQMRYARHLAIVSGAELPAEAIADRHALSRWIDRHKAQRTNTNRFDRYPSSKQVGFAERIARRRRTEVPPECFKDKSLMSGWISRNL